MTNSNIFEELMRQNRHLTEGVVKTSRKKKTNESVKKINVGKLKLESRRIFEDADFDELDTQFAVDPETSEEDEVVLVIDPEIPSDEEVPEDAAEQMIGDEVYKCPICGANYVCDCDAEHTEGIEVDEDGVPTECPICGDDSEQILIGEIAPADENAGEEGELSPQEVDEDEEEGEFVESLHEEFLPKPDDKKIRDYFKGQVKSWSEKEDGMVEVTFKDGTTCPFPCSIFENCTINEGDEAEDSLVSTDDLIVDDDVDSGVEDTCDECGLTLADPEVEDEEDQEEAPAVEINADEVVLTIDDKRFESLMTKMIRENYKYNPSFKIKKVSVSPKNRLKVEYIVHCAGKVKSKGILVAEGFDRTSRRTTLNFKDKGAFTESFTKTPVIKMECVKVKNAVIPTRISYDFRKKVNESLYRIKGTAVYSK